METLGNILETKTSKTSSSIFVCELCDYKCSKKFNLERHILTSKHLQETNGNILETKNEQNEQNEQKGQIKEFSCEKCDKEFKSRSGLWKHKKICNEDIKNNEQPQKNETPDKELIMMLVKQNTQLFEQNSEMLEIIKNGTHNTNSHNNTNTNNSHNKTFNLQFFLNETCKNAMNIMDFVDSIKLQLSDLENVGKVGYVEGISNIITTNLKALDVTQRPIHCADKKREVLYVKDENKWEKEDDDKKKIRKAIKRVACKNQRLLPKFKEEHPDCGKYHSKFSDQYNKIVVESMGGSGDNDIEKEDKIIKNISKNVTIDKE
jgi:hypothetical protein